MAVREFKASLGFRRALPGPQFKKQEGRRKREAAANPIL